MWYDSEVEPRELDQVLRAAEAAVSHAQDVRKTYAKRTGRGDRRRQTDIQLALNRLKTKMKPIRSELARLPYGIKLYANVQGPLDLKSQQRQLRAASDAIQRERRKLWKMQERRKTHGKRRTGR